MNSSVRRTTPFFTLSVAFATAQAPVRWFGSVPRAWLEGRRSDGVRHAVLLGRQGRVLLAEFLEVRDELLRGTARVLERLGVDLGEPADLVRLGRGVGLAGETGLAPLAELH